VEGIETRMIGREAELKRLQDALYDAMEDCERQVVTIVGEAGVGKSRLLYEFDNWLELLPETVRYFRGRARQEMQRLPYALLRDLFAFRFRIQDSDSAETVRQKMVQGVSEVLGGAGQGKAQAHVIGHILGFDFSHSEHLHGVRDDPQALRDEAVAHMRQFFAGNAKLDETVLFLEDLQWADDSSLDVVNHLAEALGEQRLLIVCAARPALFERRPHWGEGQTFHARLELEPLSRRDGRRLVADILQKVDAVPNTLRDLIVSSAEGNPFFIEELIKMLIEDQVIITGDEDRVIVRGDEDAGIGTGEEAWRLEPDRLAQVRVPESLTGVLQARLDRLPPQERTILQQASVVGRLFWDRAVAHIRSSGSAATATDDEVLNGLVALRERDMVFRRETSAFAGAGEYLFKHALLREITYASVLKRLRQVSHGLVADWLLEEGGERAGEITGLIADHLEAAGRTEEAVERLLQAGDQARLVYAHDEAIAYYRRALAALMERGDRGQAARTLMKLGLTYHTAFDYRRSRQAYDEGFGLWQQVAREQQPALPPAPHALRMGGTGVALTLDVAKAEDEASITAIRHLFSGLVRETTEYEDVLPDVARSWDILDGGRRYVFHLRDDVRWSDGTPVTAQDFEYAWRRILDPNVSRQLGTMLYDIKGARAFHQGEEREPDSLGIRVRDEVTLEVELERPTGYFLQMLVRGPCHPVPRHVVEIHGDDWTQVHNVVSNGPFRLESFEPNRRIVGVRNPDYHGESRGNVRRVEITQFSDETSARAGLALYEADELDTLGLSVLPLAEQRRAHQRHAADYRSGHFPLTHYLGFNTRIAPFDDLRVRRALVMAADREKLVAEVYGGEMVSARGGFVPPGIAGHSPDIGLPYNPEEARHLLAQAGYPEGQGWPIVTAGMGTLERELEHLQAQWRRELGIEIRYKKLEWPAYRELLRTDPPPIIAMGWAADYPDPDSFLRLGFPREGTGWHNDSYESLVEEARALTDQERRMALYREADRILIDEAVIMPLGYASWHQLVKPWVVRSDSLLDMVIRPH
jgi:ABC-type oligopeptide transport system substrate-binding subunit